ALRGGGLFARGARARLRENRQLFQVAALASASPPAGASRIASGSTAMHSELDELSKGEGNSCASSISHHLRRLPGDERPPYDWAEFRRRAQVGRRTSPVTWRHALLAAGLAAVVMSVALWSRLTGGDGLGEGRSVAALSNPEPGDTALTPQRQRILLQAEASGRWLASLPAEPAVARFSTRAVVTDL